MNGNTTNHAIDQQSPNQTSTLLYILIALGVCVVLVLIGIAVLIVTRKNNNNNDNNINNINQQQQPQASNSFNSAASNYGQLNLSQNLAINEQYSTISPKQQAQQAQASASSANSEYSSLPVTNDDASNYDNIWDKI
jgi:uncharacterized membrane protein YciS (DUF1049 family)